jgi:hypothetical protein
MEKLYSHCQGLLWAYSVGCFIVIVTVVVFLIILGLEQKHKTYDKKDYCLLRILLACLLGTFVFLGTKWVITYKDYRLLEKNQYEMVIGTVVGYNKAQYFENGTTDYSWPIIEESGTSDHIILDVGGTELNKTYTIYYLKYSGYGIIMEEH